MAINPEKFEAKIEYEKLPEMPELTKEEVEGLQGFITEMSRELRNEKLPVNNEGRLDMGQFGKVYSQEKIKGDRAEVEKLKEQWKNARITELENKYGSLYPGKIAKFVENEIKMGEIWEMLATAILYKNLGKDFIVVRTSEYDDICNKLGKVDTFILDKKTGHMICAFDEVLAVTEEKRKEKEARVMEQNLKGGTNLEYGIYLEEGKLKRGQIEHLPVFYLPISALDLKETLGNPSRERETFQTMMNSIEGQIGEIREKPLNKKLKVQLDFFEKSLKPYA